MDILLQQLEPDEPQSPTLFNEVAYWETGYSRNDKDGFKNMKKPDNSWGPPQQGNADFLRVPAGTKWAITLLTSPLSCSLAPPIPHSA